MTDAHPATTAPAPRRAAELVGIQYLRGIAAMMVVIFHLQPQLVRSGYTGPWLPGLSSGVDIFFVISGFIMWVTTNGRSITPVEFWRRRIVRIVPLYWIVTSFMVAMMLAIPGALQTSRFDLAHIVGSYLFFPVHHPAKPAMEPVVMPGWTLNCEMFFYLIFGLVLLAPARVRMVAIVGILAALVALGYATAAQPLTVAGFYTSGLLLEFAFGIVLGGIATSGDLLSRPPRWLGWILLLVGLVLVATLDSVVSGIPRVIVRGIPSTMVVAGALIVEARGAFPRLPALHAVGDASYSIYLSHVVTMSAVSQAWRKLHLDQSAAGLIGFCIVTVLACAASGWLCYRLVETPLTRLFRVRGRSGAAVRPASP